MSAPTIASLVADGALVVSDGYRTKAGELGPSGFPILRVAEIHDGAIVPARADHVREEFRSKIGSKLSVAGDVVLTTKGTVGRVAVVPPEAVGFAYSPQLCFFRPIAPGVIDGGWLRYWLASDEFWMQANSVSTQTDMAPYISLGDLRSMHIGPPPIEEQRGIAAMLGALDDKIESNRRAIHHGTELAIASLAGGGSRLRVGEVAELTRGLSYKGAGLVESGSDGAVAMFNLGTFSTAGIPRCVGLKFYVGDHKVGHRLAAGELLIANTDLTQQRELLGRGILVPASLAGAIHTHHTWVVRFVRDQWLAPLLWAQLQSVEFRDRAKGFATGTTVAALPANAVLDFEMSVPSDAASVVAAVWPIIQLTWQMQDESDRLVALRDALLPELLSGRIRVPEAREVVEDALG